MSNSKRTFIDLNEIAPQRWFDNIADEIPQFDQLCNIIGERFVAFAFIAGIRISSISYDQDQPETSIVEFCDNDQDEEEQLSLLSFRERLVSSLFTGPYPSMELPNDPDEDDIRCYIGQKYLLLAPIFGIQLIGFWYGGEKPPSILISLGESQEELSIKGLHEVLDEGVRSEISRVQTEGAFSIDFKNIPEAEAANFEEDYERTISLLGAWPGPLSIFLRTQEGQMLGAPEKAMLARALSVLGVAYMKTDQVEWAEDVFRLGVQWGQDTHAVADLLILLAEARLMNHRYGEAIGLFRRALIVGASESHVLPQLALCYVRCKLYIAAAVCLDQAISRNVDPHTLEDIQMELDQVLGDTYDKFRKAMENSEIEKPS